MTYLWITELDYHKLTYLLYEYLPATAALPGGMGIYSPTTSRHPPRGIKSINFSILPARNDKILVSTLSNRSEGPSLTTTRISDHGLTYIVKIMIDLNDRLKAARRLTKRCQLNLNFSITNSTPLHICFSVSVDVGRNRLVRWAVKVWPTSAQDKKFSMDYSCQAVPFFLPLISGYIYEDASY